MVTFIDCKIQLLSQGFVDQQRILEIFVSVHASNIAALLDMSISKYISSCEQVIIGGATFSGGGVTAAAPASGGAPAAQAAPAEEKKEELHEESDDGDLGLSLFD